MIDQRILDKAARITGRNPVEIILRPAWGKWGFALPAIETLLRGFMTLVQSDWRLVSLVEFDDHGERKFRLTVTRV